MSAIIYDKKKKKKDKKKKKKKKDLLAKLAAKAEKLNIDKYFQANLRNEDLNKFNLEKETIELLKVKRTSIYLLDSTKERLEFITHFGDNPPATFRSFIPSGFGLFKKVLLANGI